MGEAVVLAVTGLILFKMVAMVHQQTGGLRQIVRLAARGRRGRTTR